MTRDEAVALLDRAASPADVFGEDEAEAARLYRRLARLVHPDATADGSSRHFARLSELWRDHHAANTPVMEVGAHRFRVGETVASGDVAELYEAADENDRGRRAVLKMPRDPSDNDLMSREEEALRKLRDDGDPKFRPYVPRLVAAFRHRDEDTGETRRVNALAPLDGFVSFAQVMAAYPDGVDPRDAAWMWRRLLVALGFAHRAGVVHGAVLPEHVLVHPRQHGLVLVDWCYSVTRRGAHVPAIVDRRAGWYPSEVLDREAAVPATDVFMASRCVAALMRDRAPRATRNFISGCTLASPRRRPGDAWRLLAELDELLERLHGRRTFRPFTMPTGGHHG